MAIENRLGQLDRGQDAIVAQTTKINGSIADLYSRANMQQAALASHKLECPLRDKTGELEIAFKEHMKSLLAEKMVNKTWKEQLLYPIIKWAGLILLVLAATRFDEILRVIK
jgi:hypothetical protein